ncbi:type II toxin-antitoxin system HicA family toxin [Candidatus Margulisiibacteriota bacterium]
MPKLKNIPYRQFEKALLKLGCKLIRKQGSHKVFTREGLNRPIVIPFHGNNKTVALFVIQNNLRLLKIPAETFIETLKRI